MALSKIQSESIDLADNFAGMRFGGTASDNALDDYEEGTWTPDLNFGGANTGITYTLRKGRYVKVGRTVTAAFHIELSAKVRKQAWQLLRVCLSHNLRESNMRGSNLYLKPTLLV